MSVHPIHIGGSTRESLTVNERSTDRQYRFVLPGPELTLAEQTECQLQLRRAAASAAIVVASGSLPPGVPPDFYQQVANVCEEIGALLILDTSGGGLQHVNSGVFLLKPSVRELRECVGRDLLTESEQIAAARELIGRGCAHYIVVSLGAQGALLVTPDSAHRFPPIPVPAGSGVGAGDAMVAGIAVGLTRGWPLTKAVRLGSAAGAAKLLTPGTAPCTPDNRSTSTWSPAEPTIPRPWDYVRWPREDFLPSEWPRDGANVGTIGLPPPGGVRTPWPNHSHRRRSSSASTVRAARCGPRCGLSTKHSAATSRCAWCTRSSRTTPSRSTPRTPNAGRPAQNWPPATRRTPSRPPIGR
jgi:6-phosphofructokinase 2